jgi:hypothetical protein
MWSINDWENRALERRCSHCSRETQGTIYPGQDYLRLLQEMRGDEAEWLAHKVDPFFWSDADMLHVRLCDDCVAHLGLERVAATPPLSSASAV